MASKVAEIITRVYTALSVIFPCCLHLIREDIRKENDVTQLMCHHRCSDCCVALHPSAGISLEMNGNEKCSGGLIDPQRAVERDADSPLWSISASRRKSREIFEEQLHTSVKCDMITCISRYDELIERYWRRKAAESRDENTSRHFVVSGGSSQVKGQRKKKHLTNDCRWAFLLLASTIYNAYYYECDCWCQFGKEFSSDNAGDGPVDELFKLRDDWALGYESPPPSQHFIRRELSRYVFTTDDLQSIHPLDWLSCFFAVARMRIACRRRAEHHDIQRKKITRTWKYIFHFKTIPPSLEDQVYSLVENNLNKSFAAMAQLFGCDPLPPVRLSRPLIAESEKDDHCFIPIESQPPDPIENRPPDQCEKTPPSEKEHRVKQKTPRTNPRKKCRVKKIPKKKKRRKSSKKSARAFKQRFTITSNPDWKGYDTHGILGNVSHPEGVTQSCDYDHD